MRLALPRRIPNVCVGASAISKGTWTTSRVSSILGANDMGEGLFLYGFAVSRGSARFIGLGWVRHAGLPSDEATVAFGL